MRFIKIAHLMFATFALISAERLMAQAAPPVKVEMQATVKREDGVDPAPMRVVAEAALAKVLEQWDQPQGGRTVVRLNGVWRQEGGDWSLVFRVVADHLDLVDRSIGWVRLGDSRTVTVTDRPAGFGATLQRALDVAVNLAMGEPVPKPN